MIEQVEQAVFRWLMIILYLERSEGEEHEKTVEKSFRAVSLSGDVPVAVSGVGLR